MVQKKGPGKLRKELLVGFDPVSLLLRQIQQRFQGSVTFFVDTVGGNVIGVKWSNKALAELPFDVTRAHMLEPVTHEEQAAVSHVQGCSLSVSAVLTDVKTLGAGLVCHVQLQSQ